MFNNNNYILYLFIKIYKSESYSKTKQIKENYIISIYFNYHGNNISFDKIKNYDNTKIDIIDDYYDYYFNFDLRITNNEIIKKLDKDIYIIYYNKKYIIKNGFNNKAIRHHEIYIYKILLCKKIYIILY
jgi:hypothetical protein